MFSEIEPNERHLGTFTDPFDSSTSKLNGFLSVSEAGLVEATLLAPLEKHDSFQWTYSLADEENHWGSDRNLRTTVPQFLVFEGEQGAALLYGCQSTGEKYRIGTGGWAKLTAEFAILNSKRFVLGGSCGSIRCEISGLFDWLSRPAICSKQIQNANPRAREISYLTIDQPSILIFKDEDSQLRLTSEYRIASQNTHALGFRVRLESVGNSYTDAFKPRKWRTSFSVHLRIRDLLSISRWVPEETVNAFVTFDLPENSETVEARRFWHPVIGLTEVHGNAPKSTNQHLYPFEHLGPEGVEQWFHLLENHYFSRAVRYVVEILRSKNSGARRLQLVGFSLEALSHYIHNPDNENERISIERSCRIVMDYVADITGDDTPPDWIETFSNNYNDSKHSDKRYKPGPFEILESSTFGLYLARLAIGKLIGVPAEALRELRHYDALYPKKFRYTRLEDPAEQWNKIVQSQLDERN